MFSSDATTEGTTKPRLEPAATHASPKRLLARGNFRAGPRDLSKTVVSYCWEREPPPAGRSESALVDTSTPRIMAAYDLSRNEIRNR